MTFRGQRRVCLVREPDAGDLHVRFDERDVETELRHGYSGTASRKGRQQTTQTYCHRATSRLYRTETCGIAKTGRLRLCLTERAFVGVRSERLFTTLGRRGDRLPSLKGAPTLGGCLRH
jgi:hypothetical protein